MNLQKHMNDKSQSKTLVLDNGLKVLLISDPALNVSSAALEVQVGSLQDPKERQGLAHFLEHMLFLGTQKYPDVEAYGKYLKSNGGYSNAYTADDRTNYHFEVHHDAFEGALDRFSQFFIAPLFTPEFIEREMKAVDSEHRKNIENDTWRGYQLLRAQWREGHPSRHFGTGNLSTLEGVKQVEFKDFYTKYYSANRMALVLLSNKPLSQLVTWTQTHFSAIKNQKQEKLAYPTDRLLARKTVQVIKRKPIKDLHELMLSFPVPGSQRLYANKPDKLLGFCIGHEGPGSLLSLLKAKGLATGLGAGAHDECADYGSFSVSISLTPLGVEQYRQVMNYCFAYFAMLKKSGIPSYIFDEMRQMAALDYTYSDKGEGGRRANGLASKVNRYPLAVAELIGYRFETYDAKVIDRLLSKLIPQNMVAILTDKNIETDRTEPIYKTAYTIVDEGAAFTAELSSVKPLADFFVPKPNPFLPKAVSLLDERPVQLVDEAGASLWYSQDVEFKRPKVSMRFDFRLPQNPQGGMTARYEVLLRFYALCVQEQLNELAYVASEAGLDYALHEGLDGITLVVGGYASSAQALLTSVGEHLTHISIEDIRFKALKEGQLRSWKNFDRDQAWHVGRQYSRKLRRREYFMPAQLLAAGEKVSLDDIKAFSKTLYNATYIEGLVHGNMSADQAIASLRLLQKQTGAKALSKDEVYRPAVLDEKAGQNQLFAQQLISNNSCFWRMVKLGVESSTESPNNPKLRMASKVLGNFISQPFYTEMRTKQQLGYIVWAVAPSDEGQHYLFFIIQSATHGADELRSRADKLIATLPDKFDALDEKTFAGIKGAIRAKLLEKPKSIGEKRRQLFGLTYDEHKDFDRLQDELKALAVLSKADVSALLKKSLTPATRRKIDILLFAKQHVIPADLNITIKDEDAVSVGKKFKTKF